ncbi:odorant receptor 13a-like isoform X2 [Diachasmimorpha longicaudata]|uniref:odorant receptor 13a-like isoform X2 n=1 Tax=Diachasmimorpha longicaudata TaxID=58733 RepID=UPI0030B89B19
MQIIDGALSFIQLLTKGACGVINDLMNTLISLLVSSTGTIKIFTLWLHQEDLRYIISSTIDDWLNIKGKKSLEIMHQYAYWGRLAFILQTAPIFIALGLIIWIDPLTMKIDNSETNGSRIRHVILAPSCWISNAMPLNVYLLYYCFNLINITTIAFIYAGCDAFMFNITLHICGQFEILEANMENFAVEDDYSTHTNKIREYSRRHNHLIQLGRRMDSVVNVIILSEILSNTILICASGIGVLVNMKVGNMNSVVISWATRIYILYIQLFIYCYVGNKLSSHADTLRGIIYNCSWYNMSTHNVKDLQFMIMRNNDFCHLTGGKIVIMNYETFTKISKNVFSFFSILRIILESN